MGDRFYHQRDNLDINLKKIPRSRRSQWEIPTYYVQIQKESNTKSSKSLRSNRKDRSQLSLI